MNRTDVDPVTLARELPVPAARAWTALTRDIGRWWPLDSFSCGGPGGDVAFVDGLLVETAADGARHVWGEVLAWDEGRSVTTTWHPGSAGDTATEVTLSVVPVGVDRCRVEVLHRGWAALGDLRTSYEQGWPVVIGGLADLVTRR